MEQINAVELRDGNVFPSEEVLEPVLGDSYSAYRELLALLDRNDMEYGWRFYKDGKAWLFKAQKKKRTILWASAWKGFLRATVYFPERYVGGLETLGLSEATLGAILATKNVGKSKPCMFDIRDGSALEELDAVMRFKVTTK